MFPRGVGVAARACVCVGCCVSCIVGCPRQTFKRTLPDQDMARCVGIKGVGSGDGDPPESGSSHASPRHGDTHVQLPVDGSHSPRPLHGLSAPPGHALLVSSSKGFNAPFAAVVAAARHPGYRIARETMSRTVGREKLSHPPWQTHRDDQW